jgi:hypothetical protein
MKQTCLYKVPTSFTDLNFTAFAADCDLALAFYALV